MVEMDLSTRMNQRRGWSQSNNVKLLVIMHVLSVMRKMPARNMLCLLCLILMFWKGSVNFNRSESKVENSEQVIKVLDVCTSPATFQAEQRSTIFHKSHAQQQPLAYRLCTTINNTSTFRRESKCTSQPHQP